MSACRRLRHKLGIVLVLFLLWICGFTKSSSPSPHPSNQLYYLNPTDGQTFGPFACSQLQQWIHDGYFTQDLPVSTSPNGPFNPIQQDQQIQEQYREMYDHRPENDQQYHDQQHYQLQQYEEYYYQNGQVQGDHAFSSISPAMREQARQASEKAKRIINVSSQYFSRLNAKNARKSMSTLTSKLKNKFRQKDDPRRVFDRFSNQIRRQKRKAQENGFDGNFDDEEDDWPAVPPEEGDFNGENMLGEEERTGQGYTADIVTDDDFYQQRQGYEDSDSKEEGEFREFTQRPQFSSYEEEDAYYAALQQKREEEENQWSHDVADNSGNQVYEKLSVDSIDNPDVDPAWGDIFPGSKQYSEKKRQLKFFNVLLRGAAVQSLIITLLRPFVVLTPSLLSSFLVLAIFKLNAASKVSDPHEICKLGLHWATTCSRSGSGSLHMEGHDHDNGALLKGGIQAVMTNLRGKFATSLASTNPIHLLEACKDVYSYFLSLPKDFYASLSTSSTPSILRNTMLVGILLFAIFKLWMLLITDSAINGIDRVLYHEAERVDMEGPNLMGTGAAFMESFIAQIDVFNTLVLSIPIIVIVSVLLGLTSSLPLLMVVSTIFVDFYILEAFRDRKAAKMYRDPTYNSFDYKFPVDDKIIPSESSINKYRNVASRLHIRSQRLHDLTFNVRKKGEKKKKSSGKFSVSGRPTVLLPYWNFIRHALQSIAILVTILFTFRNNIDPEYRSNRFSIDLHTLPLLSSLYTFINGVQSTVFGVDINDSTPSEAAKLVLNSMFQAAIPLLVWSQYLGYFKNFVNNVDTTECALASLSMDMESKREAAQRLHEENFKLKNQMHDTGYKMLLNRGKGITEGPDPYGGISYQRKDVSESHHSVVKFPAGKVSVIGGMRDVDKNILIDSFWGIDDGVKRSSGSCTVIVHGRNIEDWDSSKIKEMTTISADRDIISFNLEDFDAHSLIDAVNAYQDPISQWAKKISGVNDAIKIIAEETDMSKTPSISIRKQFSLFFALQNIEKSQILILDSPTIYMSDERAKRFFTDLKQQIDRSNVVVIVLSNTMHNIIYAEHNFVVSEYGGIQPYVVNGAYEENKEISHLVRKDIRDSDPYSADRLQGLGFESIDYDSHDTSIMKQSTVTTPTQATNF